MSAGSPQDVEAIRARLHAAAERIRQRAAQGRSGARPGSVPAALPRPVAPPSERVRHWADGDAEADADEREPGEATERAASPGPHHGR